LNSGSQHATAMVATATSTNGARPRVTAIAQQAIAVTTPASRTRSHGRR
jgi:hypothetical protein